MNDRLGLDFLPTSREVRRIGWTEAALRWMSENDPWAEGPMGDLTCFFCGVTSYEAAHDSECIWQRARHVIANADPPSPTWTVPAPGVYREHP